MKIGSLFTGYGGLDMAVSAVTGAETVWVSDIDKGACKILTHRYPNAPNIGDITKVDWSQVEPIDILTGGFPCQDVSHAGKRAGLKDGTRTGLWSHMAYAIEQLKPEMVVAENVRGLLSASSPSDVEPCPWCVGDGSTFDVRALGTVLADLADLGYDTQWCGLRAADVGAPHGRFRVFVVAQNADVAARRERRFAAPGETAGGRAWSDAGRSDRTRDLTLLPTPAVNDMGAGKTVDAWDAWTEDMRAKHGNGNGHGASLSIEAQRLLPTPVAAEGTKPSNTMGVARREKTGQVALTNVIVSLVGLDPTETLLPTPLVSEYKGGKPNGPNEGREQIRDIVHLLPTPNTCNPADTPEGQQHQRDTRNTPGLDSIIDWGTYAAAVARWEQVIGRSVPPPTEPTGRDNAQRLSARFTEWMMGVPDGWITDVPDITRNEALKACGNGVVPQQAVAALRHMLGVS